MRTARQVITAGRAIRLDREFKVVIIGAGISGLAAAYTLQCVGVKDIVIYEKARRLGGTWRDNVYPGIACDVASHLYSYTFSLNPDWSAYFAPGAEILEYLESVARRFDLLRYIKFDQEVIEARYHDAQWQTRTSKGESAVADILIPCTGFLHEPFLPHIEGLESYSGSAVHSSRWPPAMDISGKRVANIGAGSTTAQLVPELVNKVDQLTVFQRTVQWMFPADQIVFTADDKAELRTDPRLLEHKYDQLLADMHRDWGSLTSGDAEASQKFLDACLVNLARVKDARLRERLRPDFQVGCKRLVLSSKFYEAIQRPNCTLVTSPISRIEGNAIRTADGVNYPVDLIIFSTGFKARQYFRSMHPVGEGGLPLEEAWSGGVSSFETVCLSGFPNLFMVAGPFSALGNQSFIAGAELQCVYIVRLLKHLEDTGARAIVPKPESEARFRRENASRGTGTPWLSGCKSWYLDERGEFLFYTGDPDSYVALMDKGPNLSDFRLIY